MSWEAVGWVKVFSPYHGAPYLVHLTVADLTTAQNDFLLWASMKRIASEAHVDRVTAQRAVEQMVADGYLKVLQTGFTDEGKPTGKPARYQLLFPACEPCKWANPKGVASGYTSVLKGVASHTEGVAAGTERVASGHTELKEHDEPQAPTDSAAQSSALCAECGGTGWADTGKGVVRCEHDGRWLRATSLRIVKDKPA